MKTMKFSCDFYTKLADELLKEADSEWCYEDLCDGSTISMECYIDDMFVTCDVRFSTDIHDDSFDHEFGTWHDPYPYVFADGIMEIDNVHIYENDEAEAPEIAGFSYEEFWAPYEKDTVILYSRTSGNKRVKAGDKLLYCGKHVVEFLAYNEMKEEYKVRYEDGSTRYISPRSLRPIEAALTT